MNSTDLGRNAAMLQLLAEQLRQDDVAKVATNLDAYSDVLEQIAASLLCSAPPQNFANA